MTFFTSLKLNSLKMSKKFQLLTDTMYTHSETARYDSI